jgi:hypothetical protein
MEWVKSLNPQQKALADKVVRAAEKYGVDPAFALSTAKAENDDFMHSVKRKSNKGAIGLMQIMPNTAKGLKIDPYNVDQNIDGGVRYLKENLDRYGGDKMLASVAYNYGPNSNFFKNGYLPDETRGYITRITKHGGYGDVPVGTMPTPPMQKISTGTQAMAKPKFEVNVAEPDEKDLKTWSPPTSTTAEQIASRPLAVEDAIAAGTGVVGGTIAGHMLRPPTIDEERNIRGDVRNELTANQQRIQLAQAQAQADAIASGQPVQAQTGAPTQERGYGTKNWVYQEYSDPVGRLVESMGPDTKPHADELAKSVSGIRQFVKNMPQGPLPMQASPFSTFPSAMPPPAPPVAKTPNLGVSPTRANLANLAPPRQLTPAQLQRQVIANRAKNVGSGKVGGGIMGSIAGQQGYDAQQKFNQGDFFGGLTSGITGTGAALTMSPNPKFKALGAASTAAGGGLHLLQNIFNTEDQTKSTLQPDGSPVKLKKGGAVKKPVGGLPAVEHFDGGGRTGIAKTVAGKIAGAFGQAPGQLVMPTAEEIAKFAPKPTQQLKFSEAIRPYQDHYLGVHMSDRQGTHGGRWGGTGFPNFQNINPIHAANKAVWMNDSKAAANRLIETAREFNGRPMINTNYIGKPDQHKSNKTVFNDVFDSFSNRYASGAIPEDHINSINEAIRNWSKTEGKVKKPVFSQAFDIRDADAVREIAGNTFHGRKGIADILGKGEGTGRQFKQMPAVPDYWNIIDAHADPFTKGASTSSVGTRLFSVDNVPAYHGGDVLHPDYRWAVTGQDKQVQFPAVPHKVAVPDWYNEYVGRQNAEPSGNAWLSYPKRPQLISKDYITMAEDAGYAEGGQVQHFDRGGKVGGLTRLAESAYDILKLTPEKIDAWRKANAKPYKQQQDPQLAQALEAYMTGKISQADYLRIMNERRPIRPLTEVPAAHSDTDIASALLSNQVEKKGILGVNLFAPQGMRVGNRLDIPAYERYGTYVDTMHDPAGKPIAYGHTGHLKNVEFQSDPNRAIRVGLGTREQKMTPLAAEEGQGKAPFAMMVGDNQVTSNDEVRRMLAEALQDPSWRQIGMNPYRGSQFYDKADMQPVFSAAEKIQAGPLVLARDVEKTSWKDPRLKTKYGVNYAQGGLTHL